MLKPPVQLFRFPPDMAGGIPGGGGSFSLAILLGQLPIAAGANLMAVPIYSVAHLQHDNPAAAVLEDRLIALLADAAEARGRVLPAPGLISVVAIWLAEALTTAIPTPHLDADAYRKLDLRSLVALAAVSAHALMLAPPTVLDASGELLWAAALMQQAGVHHPNDLPEGSP